MANRDDLDNIIEEKYRELEELERQRQERDTGEPYPRGGETELYGEGNVRRRTGESNRRQGTETRRYAGESRRRGEESERSPEGVRRRTGESNRRQGTETRRYAGESRRRTETRRYGEEGRRRGAESERYGGENRRRVRNTVERRTGNERRPLKDPEREYEYAGGEQEKEKSFFSERVIRIVGGLIGVIILLLVVGTIFGKNLFSKLTSGGSDAELASEKGVINILLVGQDGREDVEGSRSDSMMLVSVDRDTDKVKIISLMRDMYVSIPGHEDNRINAAYSLGGIDLLEQTIEQDFQVKINGNVQIDFESFKSIIDKVGGIDIELSQAEAEYMNTAYWQNGWSLSAGIQTLDGEQALAYSRIRQVGNSDFERTERQRNVLMTVFRKVKGQGKLKMLSLAKDIYPMLDTDIGMGDMISLGTTALGLDEENIETYRLPVDGGYTNQTIREMQVLVPDMEKNISYLQNLLFGSSDSEEDAEE